jgi:ribosomal protein S18 acetylase RimI-like enzyme
LDRTHELRVEPNLLHACGVWAKAADGGWTESGEGVVAVGCEAGQRAFNQAFLTSATADVGALRRVTSRYEHGRFRLRFRGDLHEAVMPAIAALGLQRQGGIPTMTMTLGSEMGVPETDLRIERVTDEVSLGEHVRVVAGGFGSWMPETLGRIFTAKLLGEPSWAGWVGYRDEAAVASSQLVVHGNVAGLYYIATVEAARRRGYADAMTQAAMLEGRARGCDLACLQASPDGRPVYERIGFEVIGEYVTYVPREDG